MNPVASSFNRAAKSYQQAARLQREVAFDSLPLLKPAQVLLDLGSGPGWFHPQLSPFCDELWALDMSPAMLVQAQQQQVATRFVLADASAVPLAAGCVDTVYSSLMLQWVPDPSLVFAEIARLLKPGGRFVLTTLVEGSLHEFQDAWQMAGYASPALDFVGSDPLMRQCHDAGLHVQAMQKSYTLFFPDVQTLAREFKQIGANYIANRSKGLGGKAKWHAFANAYDSKRTAAGLPLTYQVLFLSGEVR